MPRFDGTGPMGMGPRTGRGMGNCPCYMRGCCFGGFSKVDKKKSLEEYKAYLEEELKEVEKEIA